MNLQELLINRRSIRQYTPEALNPDDVRSILEAGLLSPTGKNARAWHFIVVDNPEMLQRLATCKKMGASCVGRATMAIVVCVDVTASETWIEDGSIAGAYMMLQARDLGIGSCWVEVTGRLAADGTPAEDVVSELLDIPEQIQPLCILAMGYPNEDRKPQNTEKLLWERVHLGTFRPEQCGE